MLMTKLADLMEQNKELLATIDAWDNGKHDHAEHVLQRHALMFDAQRQNIRRGAQQRSP